MVHMQFNNLLDTRFRGYDIFSIFMSICSSKPCEHSNNSVNYIQEIIMWIAVILTPLILMDLLLHDVIIHKKSAPNILFYFINNDKSAVPVP